jgi:cation:H+ antiporter
MLAWAADQFVLGAARLALLKGVKPIVVGVVIVGFGTSAPEMLVSALAAGSGDADIALGNVIGSNIANLTLLLGIGAMIVPLRVDSTTVRREAVLVVAATLGFAVAVQGGGLGRVEGLLLTIAMVVALAIVIRRSTTDADPIGPETVELAEPSAHRFGVEVARTVGGLVGTIAAAQILLWGALELADAAGLSGGFVGATLVAVGTSLPELVTVVQSARRRETDLIVGNLLGSNLFNALSVGGLIGLIGGNGVDDARLTVVGATAAFVAAVVALVAMRSGRRVSRLEGVFLITGYAVLVPFLA